MIYLMRHGRDDEEHLGGWSDNALTNEGIKQVKETAMLIKKNKIKIDKIICSPIYRAYESAKIVGDILGVSDIETCDYLKEQNKGLLNGMLKSEADIKYPEYLIGSVDKVYPEGESLRNLYNRIIDGIDYFNDIPNNTLVVTHRGVINMIYYYFNNIDLDMDKNKFKVSFASLHALDTNNKIIKKVF